MQKCQLSVDGGRVELTRSPDTSTVVMDVGLDVRVELSLEEARETALKRVEVLRKRLASLGYSGTGLSVP